MSEVSPVVQLPSVPVMHWKRFAELVGVDPDVVRGFCDKGYIPSMTIGKHRFINLAKFTQACLVSAE